MNRSKPAIVVGAGEMNRVTSSLESDASSDAASDARSCLSVPLPARSTGRLTRQSVVVTISERTAICIGSPGSLKNGRAPDQIGAPDDVVRREAAPRGRTLIRSCRAPDDVHAVSEADEPGSPHDVRAPDDVIAFQRRGAPDDV